MRMRGDHQVRGDVPFVGEEVMHAPYDHRLPRAREALLLEVVQPLLAPLGQQRLLDQPVLLCEGSGHGATAGAGTGDGG